MVFALALGLWACHLLPGLIFIAFGLVCRFQTGLMLKILKPYLPDPMAEEELKPLAFLSENGEDNDDAHEEK